MKNKTEVTAAHFHKLFVNSIILPPPEKVFSGVQINNPNLKNLQIHGGHEEFES